MNRCLCRFISVFCVLLAMSGCTKRSIKFHIDNPTAQPISVTIDDKTYEVAPQSENKVTIKAGEHTLDSKLTGKIKFIVYADSGGALINPTLNPYIISRTVYATNSTTAKSFMPLNQTIRIDGVPFQGPFELRDELFIERTWNFDVHEDFAETLRVSSESKGNIQSKVFSKDAFVAYFEAHEKERGRFEKLRKPVPPQWHAPATATLPHFADAQIESESKPLRDLYDQYAHAITADEQLSLKKSYSPLFMKFFPVITAKSSGMGREENEKYNAFVGAFNDLFSHSARVEN